MNEITLTKELAEPITDLSVWSKSMVVSNIEAKKEAVATIQQVKDHKKKIIEYFKDTKESAHQTWKSIVAKEKQFTDKLDEIESNIKKAVLRYDQAEQERLEAERRKLQAEAEERARKERERLLKQAEKLKTPEKQELLKEQAELIQAEEVVIPEPEKVKGSATVTRWKARVIDFKELSDDYKLPNLQLLNKMAETTKGAVNVPGVEFYKEQTLSIRS